MLWNVLYGQNLKLTSDTSLLTPSCRYPSSNEAHLSIFRFPVTKVPQMIAKADSIQDRLFRMYAQHIKCIKISLSKVEWIVFISDACTPPSLKSLMALTAPWIDTDCKMQEP